MSEEKKEQETACEHPNLKLRKIGNLSWYYCLACQKQFKVRDRREDPIRVIAE